MIYLDNAATTFRKPPQVEQAVIKALHHLGNAGRGAHAATLDASRMIYGTRERLAELFHVPDPLQIAFTCNATEALNTAIQGLIEPGDHVITTVCEHNSVLRPLYRKEDQGTSLTLVPADRQGRINYEILEHSFQSHTKAVVITHASNLTGNGTDLYRVSRAAHAHGAFLIVDASQTAGVLPIDVEKMGIDVLCFTGHKGLLGPQGTGGIYVRKGILPKALKTGGSGVHSFDREHPRVMPTALEAGTLNGHGIAGLYASVGYILETGVETIGARERMLANRFLEGVRNIDGIRLYGDYEMKDRAAIVTLNLSDEDSSLISDWLWEDYEIAVRAGAHCAPLMHQALGTEKQGAVRFSFSHYNTEEEVDQAIAALWELA